MALPIPTSLVEFILLGPLDDRRQLQDSPILGDVWVEFGRQPGKRLDLLIEPYKGQHAGTVAAEIEESLKFEDLYPKQKNSDVKMPEGHDAKIPEDSTEKIPKDSTVTSPAAKRPDYPEVAYLQGMVVARLTFAEVMEIVVPKTQWWLNRWKKDGDPRRFKAMETSPAGGASEATAEIESDKVPGAIFKKVIDKIIEIALDWHSEDRERRLQDLHPLTRFWGLTGLIYWAAKYDSADIAGQSESGEINAAILNVLRLANEDKPAIYQGLEILANKMCEHPPPPPDSPTGADPLVWGVSRNRTAMPAIARSVPAVKADAATYLFKVNCKDICWAVIDSGIDGSHPAFGKNYTAFASEKVKSRVKKSFDFRNLRTIVNISNTREEIRKANIQFLSAEENSNSLIEKWNPVQADKDLKLLAQTARERGPLRWEIIQKYIQIDPATKPLTNHGTHVAGIIGASKQSAQNVVAEMAVQQEVEKAKFANPAITAEMLKLVDDGAKLKALQRDSNPDFADGMCPDISLYDFRVLGPTLKDTEFAIIAALQFIRYLNSQDSFLTIHGANLSLSIPHDVRNFACGRTPICDECDQLVSSGVVVVAAAGNHGYKSFQTKDGSYDSYAAFSITDPGNADSIITVGATHRFWPHTYGVSFFSSRGPTGDGRLKPDLVAPGERIRAPLPGSHELGGEWGDLDGTSMAAPHVSGAAAMLMARYSELIGQPRRIKRILCESATDLERERSFQGHGMLDVLRAFQSI